VYICVVYIYNIHVNKLFDVSKLYYVYYCVYILLFIHGQNDFEIFIVTRYRSKNNFIIDHQNNYVRSSNIISNATKILIS